MAVSLTVNGNTYEFPSVGDENWGADATSWAQAVTSGMLQKQGGTFTLTAEVNFGATHGFKLAYLKSQATNVSSAGILRLGNAESIGWRNQANSADQLLTVNASDQLTYGGSVVQTTSTLGSIGTNLLPSTDDTYDLGSATFQWNDLFVGGVVYLDDDGTNSLPALAFDQDPDTGLYRAGANSLGFATAGNAVGSVDSSGKWTLGASGGTQSHVANGYQLGLTASRSGGATSVSATNTSNTASSDALMLASVAGTSAGDALAQFQVSGTSNWVLGLDNSDSDAFVISSGSALGTNNIARGTSTTLQIKGTATNDAATAGWVGEEIKSEVTSDQNIAASATFFDMTSISLTAGDWEIEGAALVIRSGATFTSTEFFIGVGTASGASSTGTSVPVNTSYASDGISTSFTRYMAHAPRSRVSISSTTTYYLKGYVATFTSGTPVYRCVLRARRVR